MNDLGSCSVRCGDLPQISAGASFDVVGVFHMDGLNRGSH